MPAPKDWDAQDWKAFRENLKLTLPGKQETIDFLGALRWTWWHARSANVKATVDLDALAEKVAARVGGAATPKAIAAELIAQLSNEESE